MSDMAFHERVYEVLKQSPGEQLTRQEIAKKIFKVYPDYCRRKQKNSAAKANPLNTDKALIGQIAGEVSANRARLKKEIKRTDSRPFKYYYTELSDAEEIEQAEKASPSTGSGEASEHIRESDYYPVLRKFLELEYALESKRIDERKSGNSRGPSGNKWLYPDIVAREDLSAEWNEEIKSCVKHCSDKICRLWSFEVKQRINSSNVRESYFQAISNSSWANFGYLVAGEIAANVKEELIILSNLHGIGLIRLDLDDPAESQISIPARERADIDWHAANRIAEANKDFRAFIKEVRKFYQTFTP